MFFDINKCQIHTYNSLCARFADKAQQKGSKPGQLVSKPELLVLVREPDGVIGTISAGKFS